MFLHCRVIEIEAIGSGTLNYMGLFLHGVLDSGRHRFFLHDRALQFKANGLGEFHYMGLFLYGCELGQAG